jgi:hypothetical protein
MSGRVEMRGEEHVQVSIVPTKRAVKLLRLKAWLMGFKTRSGGKLRGSLTQLIEWYAEQESEKSSPSSDDMDIYFYDFADALIEDAQIPIDKLEEILWRHYRRKWANVIPAAEIDAMIEDTVFFLGTRGEG